ncbi:hypothetical protein M8J75_005563 [Diaphorina citri]|nr:hypothetical protein M8J75_005563 [Diaphorina citri]
MNWSFKAASIPSIDTDILQKNCGRALPLDSLEMKVPSTNLMVPRAIFTQDQKDSSMDFAFKYAVYRLNKDRTVLPNTTLVYDIQYVPRDDSFRTSKRVILYFSYSS